LFIKKNDNCFKQESFRLKSIPDEQSQKIFDSPRHQMICNTKNKLALLQNNNCKNPLLLYRDGNDNGIALWKK